MATDDELDDLDEDDLGEPIHELAELEEVPSSGFVTRLFNLLRRRDLGSQLATLGWTGLGTVFIEFLKVIFAVFETNTPDREGSD